jgi:hypothetical protein
MKVKVLKEILSKFDDENEVAIKTIPGFTDIVDVHAVTADNGKKIIFLYTYVKDVSTYIRTHAEMQANNDILQFG